MKFINHTVKDENGIHARPAGAVAAEAKKFSSEITVTLGEKSVNCKKIFALMGLEIKHGDTIRINIDGPDEEAALIAISDVLRSERI